MTLSGSGFDAFDAGSNLVISFSTNGSTVVEGNVIAATRSQLTVAFTTLSTSFSGPLFATVTHSYTTSAPDATYTTPQTEVASVVSSSGFFNVSTAIVLTSAIQFNIDGSGFATCGSSTSSFSACQSACSSGSTKLLLSFNATDEFGSLTGASSVAVDLVDYCVVSSRTQLTILLNPELNLVAAAPAQLYATLLEQPTPQSEVLVGLLEFGAPLLSSNPGLVVFSDATEFVINGSGFSTNISDMKIELFPAQGTAVGSISKASSTQLTVSIVQLSPTNSLSGGQLGVTVDLFGSTSAKTVVATVADATPTISAALSNPVSYTSCSFTIEGSGFDYVDPGNNIVELSQAFGSCYDNTGQIVNDIACPPISVIVTQATRTTLTCTIESMLALNAGPTDTQGVATNATVHFATNTNSNSTTETVADFFRSAVQLESSTTLLDANTLYITISGCGFDYTNVYSTDAAWGSQSISDESNTVQWSQPTLGATGLGTVVNATYASIVYEFSSGQLSSVAGLLGASVCALICQINPSTFGAGYTSIAFMQTTPVLNSLTQNIFSNDLTLTVTGLNFETVVASNSIEFFASTGASAVEGTVSTITLTVDNTQAVIDFTALTLANFGSLRARVGIPGFSTNTVWSTTVEVGTVVAEPPKLSPPPSANVTTNVVSLLCTGVGFDSVDPTTQNALSFFVLDRNGLFTPANVSATATTATTRYQLEFSFDYLEPDFSGALYASVSINSSLSLAESTSNIVLVANVTPAAPIITEDSTIILSTATSFTISGFGLNNIAPGEASVVLRTSANRTVAATVASSSTRTTVVVEFLDLAQDDAGLLYAVLYVDHGDGLLLATTETLVATVEVCESLLLLHKELSINLTPCVALAGRSSVFR